MLAGSQSLHGNSRNIIECPVRKRNFVAKRIALNTSEFPLPENEMIDWFPIYVIADINPLLNYRFVCCSSTARIMMDWRTLDRWWRRCAVRQKCRFLRRKRLQIWNDKRTNCMNHATAMSAVISPINHWRYITHTLDGNWTIDRPDNCPGNQYTDTDADVRHRDRAGEFIDKT